MIWCLIVNRLWNLGLRLRSVLRWVPMWWVVRTWLHWRHPRVRHWRWHWHGLGLRLEMDRCLVRSRRWSLPGRKVLHMELWQRTGSGRRRDRGGMWMVEVWRARDRNSGFAFDRNPGWAHCERHGRDSCRQRVRLRGRRFLGAWSARAPCFHVKANREPLVVTNKGRRGMIADG